MKQAINNWLRGWGYEVSKYPRVTHYIARRRELMACYGTDLVLDVGANTGQFAIELRKVQKYRGRVVSFEPLQAAFASLQAAAAADPLWDVRNIGLGATAGRAHIHVAANSVSSSLLEMLPAHLHSAPQSACVGQQEIELATLDSLFAEILNGARDVWLKIDTQGYEGEVLRGASKSLSRIDTIQLEMSLVPLYAGDQSLLQMGRQLAEMGFDMVGVEPGFFDPHSGEMLQIDGIFRRRRNGTGRN